MPMPLYTFFENNKFDGKTIVPFITHGGSGEAGTAQTIANLQPNATVVRNPFVISRDNMDNAPELVAKWIEEVGTRK